MDTKKCTKCGEVKPVAEFNRLKASKDGRKGRCRDCTKADHYANREARLERQRAYYQANKDRLNANTRKWQLANWEYRREYTRQWREKNKERVEADRRERYWANPEYFIQMAVEWAKANPEKARHNRLRRKARLRGAGGSHTLVDQRRQYEAQRGLCYWCAKPLEGNYEIDHIVPIARGGGDGPGNICCSCRLCNRTKGAKMPWEVSDRLF